MMSKMVEEACTGFAEALQVLIAALQMQDGKPRRIQDARSLDNDALRPAAAPETSAPCEQQIEFDNQPAANTSSRIFVYVAGSRGLADLARRHGSSINAALGLAGREPYIAKVGTTTLALPLRLQQIGADRYGAAVRRSDQLVIEPGFERWVAQTIMPTRPPCDPSITLLPRAIAVDLPADLSRRAFDKGLQEALVCRALYQLPASVVLRRYVAYNLGEVRVSAAREFYALSPQRAPDCDLLLGAVEMILERHRSSGRSKDHSPSRPELAAKSRWVSGRKARKQAATLAASVDHQQLAADLGTRVRPFPYRTYRALRS